jgi:hypothetical protein
VLSEALDLRARAARAHLDAIGRYANLATCRREHLLSHFGDSAALGAAPCGGCDVCAHAPDSAPPHRRVEGRWPRSPPSSARPEASVGPESGEQAYARCVGHARQAKTWPRSARFTAEPAPSEWRISSGAANIAARQVQPLPAFSARPEDR